MTEWWALERYSESDWIMWSSVNWSDVPTITPTLIQYNQDEYEQNTCTVYAAMGAWSAVTGKEIEADKRKEIVQEAIKRWLDTSIWWRVHSAVKLVYDMMWEVSFVSVPVWSDDYFEAIKRGYHLVAWYNGNRTYNNDRDNNGVVEINNWGKTSYWHCIRHKNYTDLEVVDNYPARKTNIYQLPNIQEKQKVWGQIFYNAYFYIPKLIIDMSNLPEHITTGNTEVIKAWETETSQRLNNGGDKSKLYRNYIDEDAITRMLIDIKLIRSKLI